ncbi:hypothetical protein MJM99_33360, partial [Salmonella enterica subsp. enterica serovar Kentucky]|nr:hypothetical protein [Salmonella enterica subsp. enterica serovar Kentucky]
MRDCCRKAENHWRKIHHIIMPPLGLLIGGIDFKQFAFTLREAQGDIPAVVMHYGVFIQ